MVLAISNFNLTDFDFLKMLELIITIILIGSILGMAMIIYRKIPVLVELPEIVEGKIKENFLLRLKNKILSFSPLKNFSFEIFLQKIISKVRILTLKIESKTAYWLQQLREKSQKKKSLEKDNYWQKLKNLKNEEDEKN